MIYPAGYEADASTMLAWANQVDIQLQKQSISLRDAIGNQVIIEIKDSGDPKHATADPDRPAIIFLAPSVSARASAYYDAEWYTGNIAHELGHIVFERQREAAGGYQRADCPDWFEEGFNEFLKMLVLGEEAFETKYSRYESEIAGIVADGTAGITDVYAGGIWVLRFIDSQFGADVIKGIIASKQTTFWAAVNEQTGLAQPRFEEQLQSWLNARSS